MNLITTYEGLMAARAEIEAGIAKLKAKPVDPMTAVQTAGSRVKQVVTIYRFVRPVLSTAASLALVPAPIRAAVQLLVVALDGLAADVASADFKAGKDL